MKKSQTSGDFWSVKKKEQGLNSQPTGFPSLSPSFPSFTFLSLDLHSPYPPSFHSPSPSTFLLLSGKMFQAPDLNLIVEFILMFYKEKPIDWLLDHILWVKVCNPEKDAVRRNCVCVGRGYLQLFFTIYPFFLQKHCERQKSSLRVRFRPSLFQHVGLHSSLAGKIQKLTVGPKPLILSLAPSVSPKITLSASAFYHMSKHHLHLPKYLLNPPY